MSNPESLTDQGRSAGMVEVRAEEAGRAREALADAIRVVQEAADRHSIGIMITHVGEGCYVVRAHPAVPHGLVREQRGLEQALQPQVLRNDGKEGTFHEPAQA